MAKAVETKAMLDRAGIECPLVTGGSTGTYRFDSENPGMTELQPGSFVFMDMESYEQIPVPADTVGDGSKYLLAEAEVIVATHEGVPLYVELPTSVILEITYTEPGLQGDRSTGGTKPATVETGATPPSVLL